MTDERNDQIEGYADGAGLGRMRRRDAAYRESFYQGCGDYARMLRRPARPLSLFWRIYLRIARIWA